MRKILPGIVICLLFVISAAAQTTGRLTGTVNSPDGALSGAQIVVKDNQTNRETSVQANSDGTFTVPQLEFGTYTVTVTAAGFKTFTATDVKIDAGREYSLDATLEVGGVTESVTVTAGADVVNSTNGELSSSISPRQVQDLPLNGRNVLSLITLQPGTAANGAQETSINGQRPSAPNITLDGLNIQDNFIRANASSFAQISTTVDDVSEVTVTTQNAGAEQGNGAAQIQFVTPRGQNDFHGALYTYNRNSEFGANDFFSNAAGVERGFRNFNQFGGRVSGPVWKNRVFFFFNYESLRDLSPIPTTRTVFSDNARQGIFAYTDLTGQRRTVNLFTLTPTLPANYPPTAPPAPTGINPLIQSRFVSNIPRGNAGIGTDPNTSSYQFTQKDNSKSDRLKSRLDFDINDRNTVNVVYLYEKSKDLISDFGDLNGFTETPQTASIGLDQFIVGAYRWTPTARFSNEIRAGYVRSFPQFTPTQTEPANFLNLNPTTGVLALGVNNPETTFLSQGRRTKTFTFQDNADYALSDHGLRFGLQYNVFRALRLNRGGVLPTYTLGTNTTTPQLVNFPGGISATDRANANALYAFLGGIVTTQTQTFNVLSADSGFVPGEGFRQDYAYENLGLYLTDQWRVRSNLTVNLGLRHELWFPVRERNGVLTEIAIPDGSSAVDALLNPNGFLQVVGGNVGNQRLFKTDKNNFAPSVSVAWQPEFKNRFLNAVMPGNGKSVIRGGFRISYYNDEFLKGSSGEGDVNSGLRLNTSRTNLNERIGLQGTIATPAVQLPLSFAAVNAIQRNQGQVLAVDPNIQVPQNYEYNVSYQREIGWNTAIEIRYVGAYSNNGTRYTNQNQIDTVSNGFLADYLRARSNRQLTGNPACTTAQNAGCQPLTVFPNLGVVGGTPGGLTNAAILALIDAGTPGALALQYVSLGATGSVRFLRNPNLLTAGLLSNEGRYNYNGLQFEARRRFADGLYFQGNYTFQKTLTNTPGTDQRRFEFPQEASLPELEFGRAQYDQTHVFNLNAIYELPFGKGKRFFGNANGFLDKFVGGWQLNTIIRAASGAPFGIFDPRTTFSNSSTANGNASRNTAFSNLTKEQIKRLSGVFVTANGVYLINPSVIDPNTGRGANGINASPFDGQVFFNVQPGQVGNLERFFLNGPTYFNVDASLFKNIRFGESTRLQLRAEAFNIFNRTNFAVTNTRQLQNINSPTFGQVFTTFDPRVLQFAARFEF